MNAFILKKLMETPGMVNETYEELIIQDTMTNVDLLFSEDVATPPNPLITETDMVILENGASMYMEDDSILVTH